MTRDFVANAVAGRLYAAETAIDAALAEAAALVGLLPCARADAHLAAVTGQRAFDGAAASVLALTQARGHLVETHNVLSALARRMGVDIVAFGPIDKPDEPPPPPTGVTTEMLRARV